MKTRSLVFLALVALAVTFFGCRPVNQPTAAPSPSADPADKHIKIAHVYWVLKNIDSAYWATPDPDHTQFISIDIQVDGDGALSASDFSKVKISSIVTGGYWNLNVDAGDFDGTYNTIGYLLCTNQKSTIPMGRYHIALTPAVGPVVEADLDVPRPGSSTVDPSSMAFNEDYSSVPPAHYFQTVKRGTIQSYAKVGSSLQLVFSADDGLMHNGWLYFLDGSGSYVGRSANFRDYASDAVAAFVNSNSGVLNNDGTSSNSLHLTSAGINFASGKTFDDIATFVLVLTDGQQYAASGGGYDALSYSARTPF